MRIVCQQPNYLPWLGYFEQIARADAFVYLDDVQWIRQGRQHRTRVPSLILPGHDEKNWLTVPVHGRGHRERTFREMEIDRGQKWAARHWQIIHSLYKKSPFFHSQLEPTLRPFLERAQSFKFLLDLCEASIGLFWEPLDLQAPIWHSSDLEAQGKKSERILSICQSLEATEYYSALGASRYLDLSVFRAASVQVRWQHFRSFAGQDPRRPSDYSIVDWVAHMEWNQIRACLGQTRGSIPSFLTEGSIDGIMGEMPRPMH